MIGWYLRSRRPPGRESGGDELQNVARRLGASRAYHGVGVRETMMDLRAFYTVADLSPPDDSSCLP